MIAPGRVKYWISGGDYYIELPRGGGAWWVYLRGWHHGSIAICIYPGNNTSQARAFFARTAKPEFLGLVGKGWEIQPGLALNHRSHWLTTEGNKLSLEQYFDFWASEEIRQVRRQDSGFEDFSQRLRAQRLIDARGQRKIKKDFIETNRSFMNVCPGFEVVFAWGRAKANRLDRDEQFVEAVRSRVNEALGTWGQTL